jgi:hypothetical protein
MFRARIETSEEGQRKTLPVFPRSKKTSVFPTQEAALRAIERTKYRGRGLVYPADMNYADFYCGACDWSRIYTVVL